MQNNLSPLSTLARNARMRLRTYANDAARYDAESVFAKHSPEECALAKALADLARESEDHLLATLSLDV